MSGIGLTVCVTGASGFIASWIVKRSLDRGYTVRATVRDPKDPKKTEHLMALDGAKERLQLFKADLLDEGSFDEAIDGCHGVFHAASPLILSPKDRQAELIDPALKGTLNVLYACKKASSVKKVIITSSMAAVLYPAKRLTPDDLVDETCFSDPASFDNPTLGYALSKTLAEKAAWKFAEENEMKIVTINPGIVIGPILQPTLNLSVELIRPMVNGENPLNSDCYRMIDVRDVAFAHILALELPSASGRYILDGKLTAVDEIEKALREFYPNLRLAHKNSADSFFDFTYNVCLEKAKSLGIEFTPVEQSIRDTFTSLQEKGFLST